MRPGDLAVLVGRSGAWLALEDTQRPGCDYVLDAEGHVLVLATEPKRALYDAWTRQAVLVLSAHGPVWVEAARLASPEGLMQALARIADVSQGS